MSQTEDYKCFFEEAPIALFRTDIETGKFLLANQAAAILLGCDTIEDLIENKKATDFYSPVTRNRLLKKLRKTGILQNQEVEMTLPDNRKIWAKVNMKINGTCIECYMQDITELVEFREQELIKLKSISEKIDVQMAALAS